MRALWESKKIQDKLWEAYRARQIESREPAAEDILAKAR